MQNYEAILSELGIEIPEDKKADLKKKMEENYRTKSDYDKAVTKRDEYKNSLDDVQKELEGFKDVNVEELQTKVTTLTTQLNEEKAGRAADARKAEVEKQVSDFLTATDEKGAKKYEFLNDITADYYRAELAKALDADSAKGKSISDIFTEMITDKNGKQKAGIFADAGAKKAKNNAAKFTQPTTVGKGGELTKETFRKMNLDERLKLREEDPELYEALSK